MPRNFDQGSQAQRLFEFLIWQHGLIFLALMNEPSGTIYDRSHSYLAGTPAGSPTYGVDLGNGFRGVTYNGSTGYHTFGDASALGFERTSPFSTLVVCSPNVSGGGAGTLFGKYDQANSRGWVNDLLNTSRLRRWIMQNAGGSIVVTANAALTNGTPVMLGSTYNGSATAAGVILYNDGAVEADTDTSDTLGAQTTLGTGFFTIGMTDGNSGSSAPFSGSEGLMAVFNVVKSAAFYRRAAKIGGFLQ